MKAIAKIKEFDGLWDLKVSSFYKTEPVGYKDQPEFLNAAITFRIRSEAEELLDKFRRIEVEIGRKKRARWHEREIDIDLILLGEEIINSEKIILPHPEMHKRNFVLQPAAEIAPHQIHPVLKKSIAELARNSPDNSEVTKID